MISVHHLNNSRSQRVLWLLEELQLDYEIIRYERDPETIRAPNSLKKVHPLGKSPVIADGDTVVAESGAIIEYLVDTYGGEKDLQVDHGSSEQRENTYWMHFTEGSMMTPLIMRLVFEKLKTSPMPFFVKPIAKGIADKVMTTFVSPEIHAHFKFVDETLADRPWICGENLRGADFQLSFPLEASVARGLIDDRYPNIKRYVRQFQSRSAYHTALEKGGDYEYGPAN